MNNDKFIRFVLIALVALLAAGPSYLEIYYTELVIHMMVLGIFAMSLDLLIGFTGLVSFGHAAFFGLAGYVIAVATPEEASAAIWWVLPLTLIICAAAALLIGWFSVRTSGIYFIMITLAFAQMFFYFFNESTELGGSDGLFISNIPTMALGDFKLLNLEDKTVLYYVVLVSMLGCYFLLKTLLNAPFGKVIKGVKANDHRTNALGFNTQRYKLIAFVIAGTMAGFAGFLEAISTGIVSPGYLHWHQSGGVMMLVILGGMGTLYGPILGAFTLELLRDFFQDTTDHWHLYQGIFIILVVLLLPNGVASIISRVGALFGMGPKPEKDEPEKDVSKKEDAS